MLRWLRRLWCGLHGHPDTYRVYEADRLYLRCVCGYESEGWDLVVPHAKKTPTVIDYTRRMLHRSPKQSYPI